MSGTRHELAVLIVEEHPEVRRALREYIRALRPELRLLEARGAAEAQALAAAERPRMVLMDFSCTGGVEFAAIRRIMEGAPGCCVVAVSVYDDEAHRAAAAAAGSAAFITKRSLVVDLPGLLEREIGDAGCAAVELREGAP